MVDDEYSKIQLLVQEIKGACVGGTKIIILFSFGGKFEIVIVRRLCTTLTFALLRELVRCKFYCAFICQRKMFIKGVALSLLNAYNHTLMFCNDNDLTLLQYLFRTEKII